MNSKAYQELVVHNNGDNIMLTIHLGNGDIGITQTMDSKIDEISLSFSQLDSIGKLGEQIEENIGEPIFKIIFDNIEGLENLIDILDNFKKRVYRNNYFYEKMFP